jgi:hypothetical protein
MLLGQSIFQSVLTRLKEEQSQDEETPDEAPDYRIRGLGAGYLTPDGRPEAAEAHAGSYFDYLSDWQATETEPAPQQDDDPADAETIEQPPEPPVIPAHLERLTEQEIAEDLAISPKDNEATLNEKRRQFAKLNRPGISRACDGQNEAGAPPDRPGARRSLLALKKIAAGPQSSSRSLGFASSGALRSKNSL